jgi:hypothetical protein
MVMSLRIGNLAGPGLKNLTITGDVSVITSLLDLMVGRRRRMSKLRLKAVAVVL